MRKRAPDKERPVISDGQRSLRALGLKGVELARRLDTTAVNVSRYLAGATTPTPPLRERIEKVLGIPAGAWLVLTPPRDRAELAQTPGVVALRERLARDAEAVPLTVQGAAAATLDDPHASSTQKIAAAAVVLRALRTRVDVALAGLTERDRVTARVDFAVMTAALLDTVAAWPAVAEALRVLLAPPAITGSYFELLGCEEECATLVTQLQRQAERYLQVEGVGKASQFDSKRALAEGLRVRASLDEASDKLLACRWWSDTLGKVGEALRKAPGALEAVQVGFDDRSAFGRDLLARVATVRFITWPATQFQADPVGFVRTILGIDPEPAQVQILESVRDHGRTSCASGRRVGKTDALAFVALWRYACFEDARVFITAPTERQVERVDWIAVRRLFTRSGVCLACRTSEREKRKTDPGFSVPAPCAHSAKLDGVCADKAKTGLRSGVREVSGFTSKQAEDAQGLAGSCVTFIADEASGVKDPIFEAIEGNLSGGGRLLLLGNPTQNQGEHYESFFKKKKFYSAFRISSMSTRNYAEGRSVVAGLATREWVEEMRQMHGEDSAYFKIHILGEHAIGEDGRLISVHTITEAEERWFTEADEGELVIGLDPAGAGGEGDESTFAVRRGNKIIELRSERGLDDDAHLSIVLELIKKHRHEKETTRCVIDIEGVGSGTHARLRQYASTQPLVLSVHGVKSSGGAVREPFIYERVRDEMGARFARWLKEGGAIPTDTKLAAELHALELRTKITAKGERVKLIAKDELRKILRRSPDRYDACALAVWETAAMHEVAAEPAPAKASRVPLIDPYGVVGGNSSGEIDPWG